MSHWKRLAREKWWVWGVPLILVLVGVGLLGNYLLVLSNEGKSLLGSVDRTKRELDDLRFRRSELETRIDAVRSNDEAIVELYDERLSTESRRLTAILAEVKDLAKQAGLQAEAFNYKDEDLEEFGLHHKSFNFAVEGNYAQLRQLVHLFERSESFLTLESIGLSEAGDQSRLRINLRLSTLFALEDAS